MNEIQIIKHGICVVVLCTILGLNCDTLPAQSSPSVTSAPSDTIQEFQQPTTEVRVWKSKKNTTVEAELLGIEDGRALLKKKNGVTLRVPVDQLSDADQILISKLQNPSPAVLAVGPDPSLGKTKPDPVTPSTDGSTTKPKDPTNASEGSKTNARGKKFTALPESAKAKIVNVSPAEIDNLPGNLNRLATVLFSSKDDFDIRAALKELEGRWPGGVRSQTLVDLVANKSMSDDKFTRELALGLLIKNDPDKSYPYIIQRIDDPSTTVRGIAYDGLKKMGYTNSIKPVAARLAGPDGSTRVKNILLSFGSLAEMPIHPFLLHEEKDVRLRACSLLNKIGTQKSIEALQQVSKDGKEDFIVQLQANSAIKNIRKRSLAESRSGTLGPGAGTNRNDR